MNCSISLGFKAALNLRLICHGRHGNLRVPTRLALCRFKDLHHCALDGAAGTLMAGGRKIAAEQMGAAA